MNVVFDARYIDMSGIGTHVRNIIKAALKSKDKQITFLFSNKNKDHQIISQLNKNNMPFLLIKSMPFSLYEHIEIHNILRKHNVKIFHSPHFNIPFLKPKETKLICTIHDIAFDIYPSEAKTIFHKLYYQFCMKKIKQSANVIAVSNYTKGTLESHYQLKNVTVIHNTFDSSSITSQNLIRKEKTLLFVGINKKRKNLKFLLEVMTQLPKDIKLIIIGASNNKYLNIIKTIKELKLTKQVTCMGYISEEDLINYYQTATALIFPSLLEGFGYPVLEAGAYKLPVICASQSALPEVGQDGCLYFDPCNKNNCKEKILELLSSKELQQKLVQQNYNQLKRFDIMNGFKKLLKVYEKELKINGQY